MVRVFVPQGRNESIVTNTNKPPQGRGETGGPPVGGNMIFNVTLEDMEFNVIGEIMVYN